MKTKNLNKLNLLLLCIIPFINGIAQIKDDEGKKKQSQYIFDSNNLKQNINDISSIYGILGMYYEGVERAKTSLLDKVFHPEWFMRDTDTPNEATLNVENKQEFMLRVDTHGLYPGYASDRTFSKIEMANNNLAYVKINKMPNKNSTVFFLFKEENEWIIMDKLWVNPQKPITTINHSKISSTIEGVLRDYYTALSIVDKKKLHGLLHENWNIKQTDSQQNIKTISKQKFINQLEANTYHSPLFSIDFYHEKLVVARADFQNESITTFITLFKIDGKWKITSERKSIK